MLLFFDLEILLTIGSNDMIKSSVKKLILIFHEKDLYRCKDIVILILSLLYIIRVSATLSYFT